MKKFNAPKKKFLATALLGGLTLMGTSVWANTVQENRVETAASNVGSALSHAAITAQVKTALMADSRTKAFDINVDTDGHGRVTLAGTAPSLESRIAASEVASHVNGVRSVNNKLLISRNRTDNPKTLSSQTEKAVNEGSVTTKVKAALASDDRVSGSDISVETDGSTVYLSGDVSSVDARDAAIENASHVSGVTSVDASMLDVDRQ